MLITDFKLPVETLTLHKDQSINPFLPKTKPLYPDETENHELDRSQISNLSPKDHGLDKLKKQKLVDKKIITLNLALRKSKTRPVSDSQLAVIDLAKKLTAEASKDNPDKQCLSEKVRELIRRAENLPKLFELANTHIIPLLSSNLQAALLLDSVILDQLEVIKQAISNTVDSGVQRHLKRQVTELMQFNRSGFVCEKCKAILEQLREHKKHKPVTTPLQQLVDKFKHNEKFDTDLEKGVVITKEGLKALSQQKLWNPIASYTNRKHVGKGSFGRVYEALHNTDRVAIKVMEDIDYGKSKIVKEAVIGLFLESPLIIAPRKVIIAENAYVVMDLAEGSFETLIARSDFVHVADLLSLMRDVVDILEMLDYKGVCHNDIKPSNFVFIRTEGGRFRAKLIDFGNSFFVQQNMSSAQDVKNAASVFYFLREVFHGTVPQAAAIHFDELERLALQAASPDKLRQALDKAADALIPMI